MTLTFDRAAINENDPMFTITGTLERDETAGDLTVTIGNPDQTEIFAPQAVLMPDGAAVVTFEVEVVNDGEIDGQVLVMLTASAPGFTPDTKGITVLDDDDPANRTLGGHLFGTVTSANYFVTRSITVDTERTLVIDPGSSLLFTDGSFLNVTGTLLAGGTDAQPILFTSAQSVPVPGGWRGIIFTGASQTQSQIDHAEVSFAENGVVASGSTDLLLSNSDLHHNQMAGIQIISLPGQTLLETDVVVEANLIHENLMSGIVVQSEASNTMGSTNQPTIRRNDIFQNPDGVSILANASQSSADLGTMSRSEPRISLNKIRDNEIGIHGIADQVFNNMILAPIIVNNLLVKNLSNGMLFFADPTETLAAAIINNTLSDNGTGVTHSEPDPGFLIRNNIIANHGNGVVADNVFAIPPDSVEHNLLFNNGGKDFVNYPAGYGMITTTNANGTPADFELNIFQDPLFVSIDNFHIRLNSPAVNAGTDNAAPPLDFEGDARVSPSDIGYDEAINHPPLAMDDSAGTTEESGAVAIDVLANDSTEPDFGEKLTVTGVTQGTMGGTVTFTAGDVSYMPEADFFGAETFTYTIGDGNGGSDTATVSVKVTEINDAPTAMDDALAAVAEDSGARTIPFATLTGNDSKGPANEAGQSLTITSVSNPVGGTVMIVGSDVIFTPTADFNGLASFDYTVRDDGTTDSVDDFMTDLGSVSYTVTEVNDAPTAVDDVLSAVAEDSGARTIPFATLTGNDARGPANEAGQSLTITAVSNPVGGTVMIVGSDVIFTPTADFNGLASFDYTVRDDGTTNSVNDFKTDIGSVSYTVTEVNDAPTAVDDVLSAVAEDSGARTIPFATLTGNDARGPANEAGQSLTITAVSNPVGGTVTIVGSDVIFTPTADFNGLASFDYTVRDDGTTDSVNDFKTDVGTASFMVNDVPEPPVNVMASDGAFTDRVRVTWNAAAGATSYQVFRNTTNDPAASTMLAAGVGATSFDDFTAVVNVSYLYWVKAVNANGVSGFSATDAGTVGRSLPPDTFEVDDAIAQAKPIALDGTTQRHNIHVNGDTDWVRFTLTQRSTVTAQTFGVSGGDTTMFLSQNNNPSAQLDFNDDDGVGLYSKIVRVLDPGTYHVRVESRNNTTTILGYHLLITAQVL